MNNSYQRNGSHYQRKKIGFSVNEDLNARETDSSQRTASVKRYDVQSVSEKRYDDHLVQTDAMEAFPYSIHGQLASRRS